MTETEAPELPSGSELDRGVEQPVLEAGERDAARDALWRRYVLPVALPLLSLVTIGLWVTNLSRAFLAGGEEGALVIVLVMTIAIMAGASMLSAAPRMSSSGRTVLVTLFVGFVISMGFITLSPSEEGGHAETSGPKEPTGPVVGTLEVDALPSLAFQAKEFSVPVGVIEITYVDKGGTHTLLFDPNINGFRLSVPTGKDKGKVELAAGTYTIYCDIPGHRAAGMEAKIIAK